jgi:hypothetical protein
VPFTPKPVPFKLRPVPFKLKSVPFKLTHHWTPQPRTDLPMSRFTVNGYRIKHFGEFS